MSYYYEPVSLTKEDTKMCSCCGTKKPESEVANFDIFYSACLDCLVDRKVQVVAEIAEHFADGDEPIPFVMINSFVNKQTEILRKP